MHYAYIRASTRLAWCDVYLSSPFCSLLLALEYLWHFFQSYVHACTPEAKTLLSRWSNLLVNTYVSRRRRRSAMKRNGMERREEKRVSIKHISRRKNSRHNRQSFFSTWPISSTSVVCNVSRTSKIWSVHSANGRLVVRGSIIILRIYSFVSTSFYLQLWKCLLVGLCIRLIPFSVAHQSFEPLNRRLFSFWRRHKHVFIQLAYSLAERRNSEPSRVR